jgi:hypothetical protein
VGKTFHLGLNLFHEFPFLVVLVSAVEPAAKQDDAVGAERKLEGVPVGYLEMAVKTLRSPDARGQFYKRILAPTGKVGAYRKAGANLTPRFNLLPRCKLAPRRELALT